MKIVVEKIIDADPAYVFGFISNFENNPLWQGGMVSCKFTTDSPLRIGSQYVQKAKFLGKDVDTIFEVIAYEEHKMVKAKSIKSTFPISFQRIVEDADGKAKVKAIVEGDPSGVYRLAMPLMKIMVNRSIKQDYEKLKSMMENRS